MSATTPTPSTVSLPVTGAYHRAIAAVKEGKSTRRGAVLEYFDAFAKNLEAFRIARGDGEFDEVVLNSIDEFTPFQNEAIEVVTALARYRADETGEFLHFLFEELMPFLDRPEHVPGWREMDSDNLRFIVHELLLCTVAVLIRHGAFSEVACLVNQDYYVPGHVRAGQQYTVTLFRFSRDLRSLRDRETRLDLRCVSLHADLLEQRSNALGLRFEQVMQADFVLFVRDCLTNRTKRRQHWYPTTLVYLGCQHAPFEIFAKSQSTEYFEGVKQLLNITTKRELASMVEAFTDETLWLPRWGSTVVDPVQLMGYDKVATRP